MTDRIFALTVLLEEDIRDDDVQPLIDAIKQMRKVAAVEPQVSDSRLWAATERARMDLGQKLLDVVFPKGT